MTHLRMIIHVLGSDLRGFRMLGGGIRRIREALQDRQGAAAVEFALVSSMLLCTILFIMVVAVIVYINQALDYATNKAARQVMIGTIEKGGVSQSNFRTQYVCNNLPLTINCDNVIVNLQTLPEAAQPAGYYNLVQPNKVGLIIPPLSNNGAQFSTGLQASYEYLEVVYPITFIPAFMNKILGNNATYNGSPAYLAISTAAFRNEQY